MYYLKNIYKDPKTGHKIQLVNPFLSLGQAVHDTLDSISHLPVKNRFDMPLLERYDPIWERTSGKKGGFVNSDAEEIYKKRGEAMLRRVTHNPGPLKNLAVKIKGDLPYYWISEDENIILCGKLDWLEYLPETDSVHIIEFKTSKNKEREDSLQLPIYHLLASHCQRHTVVKASYWYLELSGIPEEKALPPIEEAEKQVLKIAKQVKLARQLERFICEHGGCQYCKPYEAVLRGEAELAGTNDRQQDLYLYGGELKDDEEESTIL